MKSKAETEAQMLTRVARCVGLLSRSGLEMLAVQTMNEWELFLAVNSPLQIILVSGKVRLTIYGSALL